MASAIRKLFGRGKDHAVKGGEIPTVPIPREPEGLPLEPTGEPAHLEQPQPEIGFAFSVGQQREHNEDSLLFINATLATDNQVLPFGLYIVADGMGGHQQGEVASGLAVRTIASEIARKILLALLAPEATPPDESIQEIVEASLMDAHRRVMKEAPGSGTTLTAVLNLDEKLTVAHVGDSRAYAIHPDGRLQALTRDHSLVMRMMEMGQISEAEAAIHPQRNVLYRALGQGDTLAPDITTSPLPEAGHLMLCSDGLWGVVPAEEITRIVTTTAAPQVACQQLVDAANAAGGPDNISVILVRLP